MKTRINLLQPSLLPVKQRLTLERVGMAVVAVLLVLVAFIVLLQQQVAGQKEQLTISATQHDLLETEVAELTRKIHLMQPSKPLQMTVQQLKDKHQGLQQVEKLLNNDKFLIEPGFYNLMRDLSAAADQQVWLQNFTVSRGELRVGGLAQRPADVPNWIDKLGLQLSMQGRALSQLELTTEEDGSVRFEASHTRSQMASDNAVEVSQ